jgi:hypothetical protein
MHAVAPSQTDKCYFRDTNKTAINQRGLVLQPTDTLTNKILNQLSKITYWLYQDKCSTFAEDLVP